MLINFSTIALGIICIAIAVVVAIVLASLGALIVREVYKNFDK